MSKTSNKKKQRGIGVFTATMVHFHTAASVACEREKISPESFYKWLNGRGMETFHESLKRLAFTCKDDLVDANVKRALRRVPRPLLVEKDRIQISPEIEGFESPGVNKLVEAARKLGITLTPSALFSLGQSGLHGWGYRGGMFSLISTRRQVGIGRIIFELGGWEKVTMNFFQILCLVATCLRSRKEDSDPMAGIFFTGKTLESSFLIMVNFIGLSAQINRLPVSVSGCSKGTHVFYPTPAEVQAKEEVISLPQLPNAGQAGSSPSSLPDPSGPANSTDSSDTSKSSAGSSSLANDVSDEAGLTGFM